MFMNILQGKDHRADAICALTWTAKPNVGDAHPAGSVQIGAASNATLIFTLTKGPVEDAVAYQHFEWPAGPALLRVDEVCFPVGAIAYRHSHSGAGFRHLVRGSLRLEADGHSQTIAAGESWFEAAKSPVRAVAMQIEGVTSFVRCMVVAPEFEGQSTFALVDPAEAQLPRLQVTHRHLDHPFYVEAG